MLEKLLALRVTEQKLLADLGPNHPRVLETQIQLREVQDFLGSRPLDEIIDPERLESGDVVSAYKRLLENDLAHIDVRERQLMALASVEMDASKKLVAYDFQDESFRSRLERKQQLYDAVLARLREINLVKDYGGYITETISPAQTGEVVWPAWIVIFGLGGLLGLMSGIAVAVAVDSLDRTFRTPEEIRNALGVLINDSGTEDVVP